MNPMIPSFNSNNGDKMSSSDINSKIDFLDSAKSIKKNKQSFLRRREY